MSVITYKILFIIKNLSYEIALNSLPEKGENYQKEKSVKVPAREYRRSALARDSENLLWSTKDKSFEFTWLNGKWNIQTNVKVV